MKQLKGLSFYIILFFIILFILAMTNMPTGPEYVYSDLVNEINAKNVSELTVSDANEATAELKDGTKMTVTINLAIFNENLGKTIMEQVKDGTIKTYNTTSTEPPWWLSMLPTLGLVLIFVVFWYFFMRQSQGGGKGTMNFGKSRAKMATDDAKKVTFSDVAGADEEKEELKEIVEFLKSPKQFTELGARIPRGVLLVGPPGTGKTLLAKAIAGEAGVPFFSISGSDFVEMFVGVGASRVRDLFEQAKKNSPSIVFIDEIDAVGRHRGAGLGGGHDEREQTLNQLLVEMDGFGVNQGVIIIAATNRPDILDPALLRPGRFDRQVVVGVPDVKGREEILKVHTAKKPLDNVDLSIVAKTTAGFTGADLENVANEAALLAARKNAKAITQRDFDDAIIKVIAGPEKKSRVMSVKERKLTAFHEAGHALVTRLIPGQDPVHQVSIIPRGRAGGYTLSLPTEDKSYAAKTEMLEQIIILLGGRVAESLALDDISTGASNDIERATKIAKGMVTKYGMSDELGTIVFGTGSSEVFLGRDYGHTRDYSETVAAKIDSEIKRIIDDAYARCTEIIGNNMEKLTEIAELLLERETINGEEFEELFSGKKPKEVDLTEETSDEATINETTIEETAINETTTEETTTEETTTEE
ncbi:MAG: ATP-dependent zinc metalloprotease FtsH [Eubacteriales bacterium]|nr:ATP-dependent zinc metalloprotease FtsH [Eubacteriales bacterium]